jgi:hypothetical protein
VLERGELIEQLLGLGGVTLATNAAAVIAESYVQDQLSRRAYDGSSVGMSNERTSWRVLDPVDTEAVVAIAVSGARCADAPTSWLALGRITLRRGGFLR